MKSIRCHLEGSQECAGCKSGSLNEFKLGSILRCCLRNRFYSSYLRNREYLLFDFDFEVILLFVARESSLFFRVFLAENLRYA